MRSNLDRGSPPAQGSSNTVKDRIVFVYPEIIRWKSIKWRTTSEWNVFLDPIGPIKNAVLNQLSYGVFLVCIIVDCVCGASNKSTANCKWRCRYASGKGHTRTQGIAN